MVPVFDGDAVNVTGAFAQMLLLDAVIASVGAGELITFITIPFETVVGLVMQMVLTESVQVTISPLFKLLDKKVGLFVPAFTPFIFH